MESKPREINRHPDQDLYQLPLPELHTLIRRLESEKLGLASDHARMMKDINKRMQIHLLEIRGLKEVNQRLQDDSQELRDLCVFLDDDRQKSRKLAREWQRFGRYTSSVMKSEVSAYQEKLNELELRQNELLKENIELKELCIYLDDERSGAKNLNNSADSRDQGDGSSISSLTNEQATDDVTVNAEMTSPTKEENVDGDVASPARSTINDHTTQYIHQLESHIKTLEDQLTQVDIRIPSKESSPPLAETEVELLNSESKNSTDLITENNNNVKIPEAGDQLEQIAESLYNDGLNEMEKTVLRQILCKMVQRKFDNEAKQRDGKTDDHSPLPTDPTHSTIDSKFSTLTTSDEQRFPLNNPPSSGNDFYERFNPPRQVRPDVTNSYQDYGHYGSYTLPDNTRPHHQGPPPQSARSQELRNGDIQRYEGERIPYDGQGRGQFQVPGQGQVQNQFQGESQGPSQFLGQGQGSNRFQGQGQGQNQFQGESQGPNRFQGQGQGPNQFQGQGQGPNQFQGQGQGPNQFPGRDRGPPPDYDRAMGYPKGHPPDYPGPRVDYRRGPDYGGRAPPQGPPEYGRYAGPTQPSNAYVGPVPPNNAYSGPVQPNSWGYQSLERRKGPRQ